jgi:hypothetical protein
MWRNEGNFGFIIGLRRVGKWRCLGEAPKYSKKRFFKKAKNIFDLVAEYLLCSKINAHFIFQGVKLKKTFKSLTRNIENNINIRMSK